MISVAIIKSDNANDLPLPAYASQGASGMDVLAAVESAVTLRCDKHVLIPCGFSLAVPAGYEAQIRSRSGYAFKHGVFVLNSPGTIDSDYRGEVAVILANLGKDSFIIERGMRIAQLVIAPVIQVNWKQVTELPDTSRGAGGFGSTGEGRS